MDDTPLNRLGAAAAARRMAAGELRAEDLLRACLVRIDEREREVRAFVHLDASAALAQARALDAGPWRGPLHGLPLGVKDLFDTVDMPSQYGSPIYAGHRAAWDAAAVAICRQAGAIVLGKTVTTEFATFEPGPTRNPHALDRTPGGSSSGSAAAVADGMLPLAFGTQTAGSIVRPAAFCGVVGFKPSFGRVPRAGMKLLSESLDTVGGFGRTVEDAALLASVLTGDERLREVPAGLGAPRIGFFAGPQFGRADDDVQALWAQATGRLARLAPGSSDLATPAWFEDAQPLQMDLMAFEAARSLAHEQAAHAALISPRLTAVLRAGAAIPGHLHAVHLLRAQAMQQRAAALFEQHDLLLAPSALGQAPPAAQGTGDPVFCRAWTLLGLPCLHLPLGRGADGLPIGLQLVGPPHGDARVLRGGAWLERAWPGL